VITQRRTRRSRLNPTPQRRDAVRQRDEINALVDILERSRIHGRGGGAFPTATKLRAVASQSATPAVVVNGCEGEPLSRKDRYLLSTSVDTVLDGALAVATALRAAEVVIALDRRFRAQADAVSAAIAARPEFAQRVLSTRLELVPSGYVSGQETALLEALAGRDPKPTLAPPYPFQRGLHGRPTFVSNVETFAQIGRAAAESYDGTRLVTVGGAVTRPGVATITPDTTFAELLRMAGGPSEPITGVLLGGYGGTWTLPLGLGNLRFDELELRERGLTLGAGIAFLLGESACPVAEVAHVTRWMASQSAGQCGPCVRGVGAIAGALTDLTRPGHHTDSHRRIERWTRMISGRGACAHPDGVSRFVTTALEAFPDAFDGHARNGGCERCATARVLPTPRPAARERPRRPSTAAGAGGRP
jgi:NADH:ubiquinone oxidoreductase subunit F (NADH-binding)